MAGGERRGKCGHSVRSGGRVSFHSFGDRVPNVQAGRHADRALIGRRQDLERVPVLRSQLHGELSAREAWPATAHRRCDLRDAVLRRRTDQDGRE